VGFKEKEKENLVHGWEWEKTTEVFWESGGKNVGQGGAWWRRPDVEEYGLENGVDHKSEQAQKKKTDQGLRRSVHTWKKVKIVGGGKVGGGKIEPQFLQQGNGQGSPAKGGKKKG